MITFRIGHSFEDEAEADLAAHSNLPTEEQVLAAHGPLYKLRVLIPPALLVFYAMAADRLGFYVTTALMIVTAALVFGARPRLAVPIALIAPVLVHVVFYKLLRVPLPAGLVPMPW
jgi:putative tricarboxylic transport membrane protein